MLPNLCNTENTDPETFFQLIPVVTVNFLPALLGIPKYLVCGDHFTCTLHSVRFGKLTLPLILLTINDTLTD